MLRLMYSLSFCAALGLTLICSTTSGQPAPTIRLDNSSSTKPIAGMRKSRSTIAENTATAQINDLEAADYYTLSDQISTMQIQLQATYSITAQLSKLSLVNYL